jgi:hypothetical protein
MNSTTLPIIIAAIAVIVAINAFRGIQRGGSRFYALEREAMLRRAGFTLLASVFLFVATVGLLIWQNNNLNTALNPPEATPAQEQVDAPVNTTPAAPAGTDVQSLESFPPTRTPLPTADPNLPTPSPTPIIRRAIVSDTGGSGVYLRQRAGTDGEILKIVDEGDVVTLIETESPVDANGFTWVKVRDLSGEEGWTVELYLDIQP